MWNCDVFQICDVHGDDDDVDDDDDDDALDQKYIFYKN